MHISLLSQPEAPWWTSLVLAVVISILFIVVVVFALVVAALAAVFSVPIAIIVVVKVGLVRVMEGAWAAAYRAAAASAG